MHSFIRLSGGGGIMKRLIAVVLLLSVVLSGGCAGGNLEIIKAEYRAQYIDEYSYGTPILIDSIEKWQAFLDEHPEQSTNEDVLQRDFDKEFFKDRVVYVYVSSEASGSNQLAADKAEITGDTLKLYMTRTIPETGTDDMAARVCIFGLKRENIKNVKTVEVMIEEIRNSLADINGLIFTVEENRILVVADVVDVDIPEEEWFDRGNRAIWFSIDKKTVIEYSDAKRAAASDLKKGQAVHAWADGATMKSYPEQATAQKIVIVAEDK
jgi:hypothetical protein